MSAPAYPHGLAPIPRRPAHAQSLGIRLVQDQLTECERKAIIAELLVLQQPGNCFTWEAADQLEKRALAAGFKCYVRSWHLGEVGYFCIHADSYRRILNADTPVLAPDA